MIATPCPGSMAFFVGCNSTSWALMLDQVVNEELFGAEDFNFEIRYENADLSKDKAVAKLVDTSLLPKAIGGNASSCCQDGTEDYTYSRGVAHRTLSQFLSSLDADGMVKKRASITRVDSFRSGSMLSRNLFTEEIALPLKGEISHKDFQMDDKGEPSLPETLGGTENKEMLKLLKTADFKDFVGEEAASTAGNSKDGSAPRSPENVASTQHTEMLKLMKTEDFQMDDKGEPYLPETLGGTENKEMLKLLKTADFKDFVGEEAASTAGNSKDGSAPRSPENVASTQHTEMLKLMKTEDFEASGPEAQSCRASRGGDLQVQVKGPSHSPSMSNELVELLRTEDFSDSYSRNTRGKSNGPENATSSDDTEMLNLLRTEDFTDDFSEEGAQSQMTT